MVLSHVNLSFKARFALTPWYAGYSYCTVWGLYSVILYSMGECLILYPCLLVVSLEHMQYSVACCLPLLVLGVLAADDVNVTATLPAHTLFVLCQSFLIPFLDLIASVPCIHHKAS